MKQLIVSYILCFDFVVKIAFNLNENIGYNIEIAKNCTF